MAVREWNSVLRARSHRVRLTLAAVGVGAGVAMLVTIASLVESYREHLNQGFEILGSSALFVEPLRPSYEEEKHPEQLTGRDVLALKLALPEARVAPLYSINGQVSACGTTVPVLIQGIVEEFALMTAVPEAAPRSLSAVDVEARLRTAVIGSDVRARLHCGFAWTMLSISGRPFDVVGVMSTEGVRFGTDYGSVVMIPASTFLQIYGATVPLARIVITANDHEIDSARSIAERVLRARHHLRPSEAADFKIYSATDVVETSRRLATTLKSVAAILLLSSVLVGMVGLANSVLMGVVERIPEIGVCRVVGASRQVIARQFLVEGTLVGLSGAIGGVIVGALGAVFAELSFGITMVIDWKTAMISIAVATLLSLITSLAPAYHAARINVIDAVQRH